MAALVGCDYVVAGIRQWRHHLAPAIGQFREPVQSNRTLLDIRAMLRNALGATGDVLIELTPVLGGALQGQPCELGRIRWCSRPVRAHVCPSSLPPASTTE
jgi:hypothetical protein